MNRLLLRCTVATTQLALALAGWALVFLAGDIAWAQFDLPMNWPEWK